MPGECQWLYGATICDLYDHFFVELHIDSNRIDWIELVWSYFAESSGQQPAVPYRPVVGLLFLCFKNVSNANEKRDIVGSIMPRTFEHPVPF